MDEFINKIKIYLKEIKFSNLSFVVLSFLVSQFGLAGYVAIQSLKLALIVSFAQALVFGYF